jgi:hypothetical protein
MKIKKFNEFDTMLISAFPGCGKSHLFRNNKEIDIIDSDSSTFDKSDFPSNYIEHIKENIGKRDVILISSHKEVRDALVEEGLDFLLVYPKSTIKEEYIQRYIERGNDEKFVELLEKNWDMWLDELEDQKMCSKLLLNEGEYLSDVISLEK